MTEDTSEVPEEATVVDGPAIARMGDEAIACRLRACRFITGSQFDAWMRRRAGETFQHIADTGPINPFTGRRYDRSAIEEWVAKVSAAVALARKIELPIEREPAVWGHWIAEGHIVRLAADNTAKKAVQARANDADKVPPSHFPDAERLRASGKKPR